MAFKSLKAIFGDAKNLSVINDKIDEVLAEETSEETEETSEETEETEDSEESEGEETEESEETEEETSEEEPDLASAITMLTTRVEELTQEVMTLKAERDEAKKELAAKKAEEKAFIEKLPKLFVSLSTEKPETAPEAPVFTNGIGEL